MPNIVEYNICYQSQTTAELNGILENIQQVDVLRLHSYFLPLGKYNIWIKAQMEDGSFIVSPKVEL